MIILELIYIMVVVIEKGLFLIWSNLLFSLTAIIYNSNISIFSLTCIDISIQSGYVFIYQLVTTHIQFLDLILYIKY